MESGVRTAGWIAILVVGFIVLTTLTGCLAVGYTSTGGWFVWPGGLTLILVVLFVFFLLRRRR